MGTTPPAWRHGDFLRTVVIGNGGSGKSWLAERLSGLLSAPAVDLDPLHWEPGGYNVRRDPDLARRMVREAAAGDGWIIEGVYGWLAREALPRATALVWLDIDDGECVANVRKRGIRRGGDPAAFAELIAWVGEYRVRQNANSHAGHERLFEVFPGRRLRPRCRDDVALLLSRLSAGDGRAADGRPEGSGRALTPPAAPP